jgi:hypothetical protein
MTPNAMQTGRRAQVVFHLTGRRDDTLAPLDGVRPALLAGYADLAALRHDYPLVLLHDHPEAPFVPLARLVDGLAAILAPAGAAREQVGKQLRRHERAIRRLVADGVRGSLAELWTQAGAVDRNERAAATLERALALLEGDAPVLDCTATAPAVLFEHAWRHARSARLRQSQRRLERLVRQLSDILAADFAGSAAALAPERLRAATGAGFADAFDFERMAALLAAARPPCGLCDQRRQRIAAVLEVLRTQRFFRLADGPPEHAPYRFVFEDCEALAQAWRERLPHLVEVARAMAIAALEVAGEYQPAEHDALFEDFGARGLAAEELAWFPDYLLLLADAPEAGQEALLRLLAGGLPVKALVRFDDLLDAAADGSGPILGSRSRHLLDALLGIDGLHVVQASASHLVAMRDRLMAGLAGTGPACCSVYTGAAPAATLPPYLLAAAAMESRVFPAVSRDPGAGELRPHAIDIGANVQPEADWPQHVLRHEDAAQQRVELELAFTAADFLACDPRCSDHFARIAAAADPGTRTVRDWLDDEAPDPAAGVPALRMVDREHLLQQAVVDAPVIEQARRCRAVWRRLQALGGVHDASAERLLAEARRAWEAEQAAAPRADTPAAAEAPAAEAANAAASTPPPTAAADAGATPAAAPSADEPLIETPRCTTCEECVQINNRMFAYDDNRQAYIADLSAGSYRQLVEAAEACQVSIIHPGRPRDPSEPGIEELLERAEAFR